MSKPALSKLQEGVELARSAEAVPSLIDHLFVLASTLARLKMNGDACQRFIECRDLARSIGINFSSIILILYCILFYICYLYFYLLTDFTGNRVLEEKVLFFLGSLSTDILLSSRYFDNCLSLCRSFRDAQRNATRFYDILGVYPYFHPSFVPFFFPFYISVTLSTNGCFSCLSR